MCVNIRASHNRSGICGLVCHCTCVGSVWSSKSVSRKWVTSGSDRGLFKTGQTGKVTVPLDLSYVI